MRAAKTMKTITEKTRSKATGRQAKGISVQNLARTMDRSAMLHRPLMIRGPIGPSRGIRHSVAIPPPTRTITKGVTSRFARGLTRETLEKSGALIGIVDNCAVKVSENGSIMVFLIPLKTLPYDAFLVRGNRQERYRETKGE